MALDPGETTGMGIFVADGQTAKLTAAKQLKTWPLEDAVFSFTRNLDEFKPKAVVFESYRVYGWKTDEHAGSDVPTIQIIGCLRTLCIQRGIPVHTQSAQIGKQFCTDEKLTYWGFWQTGLKHARDAIRHGCYFLIFGPAKPKK